MRKTLLAFSLLFGFAAILPAQTAGPAAPGWRDIVSQSLPLLGHRNWILIVDSAYPLQSAPGVQTVETGAGQLEVLHHVLSAIDKSNHVRPVITMDAELPFVPEQDAPGVSTYRTEISDLLRSYPVDSLPHDRVIATIEEASKHFNVLVLKTNMTIPYTSVFIRLDCKYWGADAEQRLRATMAAKPQPGH